MTVVWGGGVRFILTSFLQKIELLFINKILTSATIPELYYFVVLSWDNFWLIQNSFAVFSVSMFKIWTWGKKLNVKGNSLFKWALNLYQIVVLFLLKRDKFRFSLPFPIFIYQLQPSLPKNFSTLHTTWWRLPFKDFHFSIQIILHMNVLYERKEIVILFYKMVLYWLVTK